MSGPSRRQLALLHVGRQALALEDAEYRAILRDAAGVDSSKDLDGHGFDAVLERFDDLGWRPWGYVGDRPGMASRRQAAVMLTLWGRYTDGRGTPATLGKWLDGTFGVSALRFLRAEDAPRAIAALLAMADKRAAAAPAETGT